jgi:hypothetical protein
MKPGSILKLVCLVVAAALTLTWAAHSSLCQTTAVDHEYLWYEAENMRGITETSRHEPQLNPS